MHLPPGQKPACPQNIRRQRFSSRQQFVHQNALTRLQARYQSKIGAGEQANIVRILAVKPFKAAGNYEFNACVLFSRRAVFA